MKAIILAAGRGTRMGKYTENLPKGMLVFEGKTLIERQLETLRESGINDIAIATGYESEKINYGDVKYFHNENFATTNMVETLMCADEFLDEDLLVAYSDILYTKELVELCCNSSSEIGVAVDSEWKKLWALRYGSCETDLESLQVEDGKILELGKEINSSKGLAYRYIGLIKFTKTGLEILKKVYNERKEKNIPWAQSGKAFELGYMTDILAEITKAGYEVNSIVSKGNWLEFDTNEDYEKISKYKSEGIINNNYVII
jgi:choline kinase